MPSVKRQLTLLPILVALAFTSPAPAASPLLHVPIPENLQDDWSLGATVAGDLPAALETKNGLVRSPDARKPPAPNDPAYAKDNKIGNVPDDGTYSPDRDTQRPDVMGYDEPFRPATAPFKRLSAFDSVDASYKLRVRLPEVEPLPRTGTVAIDGSEEQFFADIVADLRGGTRVRIPSVGPGAHVIRAHVAVGDRDVPFSLWKDGADNWFVSSTDEKEQSRARLVMELSIFRSAFGGEFGNPTWDDFKATPKLPPNVAAAAKKVQAHIGVNASMTPREVVKKLVAYHRSFVDSNDPPSGQGDIYLDLALSQKGVCRHRAFSFLVTALGMGIPTRMVINEAHAWVEVHDGKLWRRIDLGGAGRTPNEPVREGMAYEPPADPFQWPTGATPGETLLTGPEAGQQRNGGNRPNDPNKGQQGANQPAPGSSGSSTNGLDYSGGPNRSSATNSSSWNGATEPGKTATEKDDRPRSQVALTVTESDTRRGAPLRVNGTVVADREPCSNVVVDIAFKEAGKALSSGYATELRVGSVATNAKGEYQGALIVPTNVPVGDYEVVARTSGNMRCGKSY